MKRLYVYILKAFIGPFIATFFVSLFVLFMQFLWLYVDDLVGKGLDTMVVLEFVFNAILTLLPRSVPLAVLLASLMSFGNMGERLELLSIKAAGVSLFKAMTPLVILATILSGSMLHFNNKIYPEVNRKLRVLVYDIKRAKPEMSFKKDVFNSDIPGITIRIKDKDVKSGMMYGLQIYDKKDKAEPSVTIADSGNMVTTNDEQFVIFTLYNGRTYGVVNEKKSKKKSPANIPEPFRRDTFETQVVMFEIDETFKRSSDGAAKNMFFSKNLNELKLSYDSIENINATKGENFYKLKIRKVFLKNQSNLPLESKSYFNDDDRVKDLDSLFYRMPCNEQVRLAGYAVTSARRVKNDINERMREEENTKYNSRKHLLELNNRIALSLLSLIMFFIGAPLGAIVRKGGLGLPVVLSVFFFVLYYIVDNFGRHLTVNGGYSPYFGAWLSTMVLLPVGIFLTRQATTDSVIMNVENYYSVLKRIFKKRKK